MDQQFALKWVQTNVAAFGGDRDRVTIFGQSAGALSTLIHLVSPTATGLFDGAIVQSGAITLSPKPQVDADARGLQVAAGIAQALGQPSCNLACLRGAPVPAILSRQLLPFEIGYFPNVDGKLIEGSIEDSLASGDFHRVPVIHGTTRDEGSLFVLNVLQAAPPGTSYEQLIPAIVRLNPDYPLPAILAAVPEILTRYPLANYGGSLPQALTAVGTDAIFACSGYYAAQLTDPRTRTYYYEFDDRTAPQLFPTPFPLGAYHASEIPYVGFWLPSIPAGSLNPQQTQLSQTMVRYWEQFARLGTPNSLITPFWPQLNGPFVQDRVKQMVLPQPVTRVGAFDGEHQCDFWLGLRP
jgi:para-nitrobenzyl esterase